MRIPAPAYGFRCNAGFCIKVKNPKVIPITDLNKQLDNAMKRIEESGSISKRNKKLIIEFERNCFAQGRTVKRILKLSSLHGETSGIMSVWSVQDSIQERIYSVNQSPQRTKRERLSMEIIQVKEAKVYLVH